MDTVGNSAGLIRYKMVKRLEEEGADIGTYIIETSMNSPVHINKEIFDTYLWTTYDRTYEKLSTEEDKNILQSVNQALSEN